MSRTDIITGLFLLTMAANVVALVRHWRMMCVMRAVLNNLIETQRQFNAMIDADPRSH